MPEPVAYHHNAASIGDTRVFGSSVSTNQFRTRSLKVGLEDSIPTDTRHHIVDFGGEPAHVLFEQYGESGWIASVRDTPSIFADGESLQDAMVCLYESATEDLELLSSHGGPLSPHLNRKLNALKSLLIPHASR